MMRVWLRNPAYFLLLKALLHQICKKNKKTDQNAPQKSRKIRKTPAKTRKSRKQGALLFLHTVASFVVVFVRHRDKQV